MAAGDVDGDPDCMDTGPGPGPGPGFGYDYGYGHGDGNGFGADNDIGADTDMVDALIGNVDPAFNPFDQTAMDFEATGMHGMAAQNMTAQRTLASYQPGLETDHHRQDSSPFGDQHQSIYGRSTPARFHSLSDFGVPPEDDFDSAAMDDEYNRYVNSIQLPQSSLFGEGGAGAQSDPNATSTRDEFEPDVDPEALAMADGDEDEACEGHNSQPAYDDHPARDDYYYASAVEDDNELPAHLLPGGMVAMLQNPNASIYYGEEREDNQDDRDSVQDDAQEELPEDQADGDYVDDGVREDQPEDDDEEDEEEVQVLPIKYELRQAARQTRQIMSTVQDRDESGNYDPSEERKGLRRAAAPKTPKTPKRPQEGFEESPIKRTRTNRQISPTKARQLGEHWVVVLKLKSDAGKELLGKYPDNWPLEGEHNCFADIPTSSADDDAGLDSPTRRLRPRRRPVRYDTPFEEQSLPALIDPAGEHDDLRGHPAARGCVRCRKMGHICDLRKPGGVWPCVQCVTHFDNASHIPCEMITPPERKQRCEQCHDDGIDCSYAAEEGEEVLDDHSAPCRQCAASKKKCIAGPHPDGVVSRATYTPPPGVKYTKVRPFISCTPCRRTRKTCSLKKKGDEPPCKACLDSGTVCTFERLGFASKTLETNSPVVDGKGVSASNTLDANAPTAKTTSDLQPATNELNIADASAMDIDGHPRQLERQKSTFVASGPSDNYYAQFFQDEYLAGPSDLKGKGKARQSDPEVIELDAWEPKSIPKDQTKLDSDKAINPYSTSKVETKAYAPSDDKSSTRPKMQMEDANGNKGFVDWLLTAYAHPIVFNSDSESAKGCQWCQDTAYALYGIGWVKPNVIAWADKCGYTELDDGHRSNGIKAGNMCVGCVETRLEMMTCDEGGPHEDKNLRSLWPMMMDAGQKAEASAAQFQRLYNGKPAADDTWCSVCPGVAAFECCRPRSEGVGCDLKFCDGCYQELLSCKDGLKGLLGRKLETEERMKQARADASFLLEDGILMSTIWKAASK